jgi:hypothetical protein
VIYHYQSDPRDGDPKFLSQDGPFSLAGDDLVLDIVGDKAINDYMRHGILPNGMHGKIIPGLAKQLEETLKKFPKEEGVFYRGIRGKIGTFQNNGVEKAKIKIGDTVFDEGFSSTTTDMRYAKMNLKIFGDKKADNGQGVIFRIEGESGRNISSISIYKAPDGEGLLPTRPLSSTMGEAEVVFTPKTHFLVQEIETIKNPDGSQKFTIVYLKEVSGPNASVKNIYTGEEYTSKY